MILYSEGESLYLFIILFIMVVYLRFEIHTDVNMKFIHISVILNTLELLLKFNTGCKKFVYIETVLIISGYSSQHNAVVRCLLEIGVTLDCLGFESICLPTFLGRWKRMRDVRIQSCLLQVHAYLLLYTPIGG